MIHKANSKFFYLILSGLLITLIGTQGCKKSTLPVDSNYDQANNIFRVKVSSSGVAYTVSVTESGSNGVNDVQQGAQNSGAPFEYPFTPSIGDTIKLVVKSAGSSVYIYPLYKGIVLAPVPVNQSGDGYIGTFTYVVKN